MTTAVTATKTVKAARAVTTDIISVTPKQAREWLETNHVNRRKRPKVVSAYRRDMEQGRWKFTGEAIKISRTGALIDGQHRLMALGGAKGIRSVDMLVVTGLPDDVQSVMDQGIARNIRDALTLEYGEVKYVPVVGSICRWLSLSPEVGPLMNPSTLRNKVTAAEALEIYGAHAEEISEAAYQAYHLRPHLAASPTPVGYTWLQLSKVDPQACQEFFAGMKDMEWAWKNDPRKAAVRRLRIMKDQGFRADLETGIITTSVLTRAWNAWRKQEEVETIAASSSTGIILPVAPI